jgi:hypothetical protein
MVPWLFTFQLTAPQDSTIECCDARQGCRANRSSAGTRGEMQRHAGSRIEVEIAPPDCSPMIFRPVVITVNGIEKFAGSVRFGSEAYSTESTVFASSATDGEPI